MAMWYIIINENMHDAHARISDTDEGLAGWERVWSAHESREVAEAELPAARIHADGRTL